MKEVLAWLAIIAALTASLVLIERAYAEDFGCWHWHGDVRHQHGDGTCPTQDPEPLPEPCPLLDREGVLDAIDAYFAAGTFTVEEREQVLCIINRHLNE